jgi:hypothetical protein
MAVTGSEIFNFLAARVISTPKMASGKAMRD